MPRIYKGSETILKLLIDVPSTSVIDKIKIALFTTDRSIAMEFYADSITLHGNIAYLNAPEWTFVEMQDGIINYIAQGESNSKPFIFERQSNYILKSFDGFEMSDIMNGYYTKEEVDTKLDLEQDTLVSGKTIKTINGESILGSGNIEIKVDDVYEKLTTEYYNKNEIDAKVETLATDENLNSQKSELEGMISSNTDLINEVTLAKWDIVSGGKSEGAHYGSTKAVEMKTINGESILGWGDISVQCDLSNYYTKEEVNTVTNNLENNINDVKSGKWAIISGGESVAANYGNTQYAYLKTINGESLIGEGDITIEGGGADLSNYYTKDEVNSMIGDINNILSSI